MVQKSKTENLKQWKWVDGDADMVDERDATDDDSLDDDDIFYDSTAVDQEQE